MPRCPTTRLPDAPRKSKSCRALALCKYYDVFTPLNAHYWHLFISKFHISGFDPITYSVVSDWTAGYNVYRHPLLAFYMYVPYLVNQALIWATGINCAIFIVTAIQLFSAFYAAIFLYRICREIVGVSRTDSTLLTFLLFGFAFVMLSSMVPDHFIISMMLLRILPRSPALTMSRASFTIG